MTEQLTHIESGVSPTLPSQALVAAIGHNALEPQPSRLEFTDRQFQVLVLGSLGGTKERVATILSCDEEDVTTARDELIDMFSVRNLAAVVNKAILMEYLPIKVNKELAVQQTLGQRDMALIHGFRSGHGNTEIGRHMGKSKDAVGHYYSRALFRKIDANGRTHTVRKSYELGIEIPPAVASF
jgi:DNA-binding NarL/FixJ family response regulator